MKILDNFLNSQKKDYSTNEWLETRNHSFDRYVASAHHPKLTSFANMNLNFSLF
jgi:hypothetical protein